MKLSKQDLRIIMAIKQENAPMGNYLIARRLGKHPAQTFKRLRLMAQNRVLRVIEGNPKFYDLNASNQVQSFIILTIECPKCKMLHIRHQSQTTIQCHCKTSSGKFRRFFVYNSRIKNKKVLTAQAEEDKTAEVKAAADQEKNAWEIERDVKDMLEDP